MFYLIYFFGLYISVIKNENNIVVEMFVDVKLNMLILIFKYLCFFVVCIVLCNSECLKFVIGIVVLVFVNFISLLYNLNLFKIVLMIIKVVIKWVGVNFMKFNNSCLIK